MTTSAAYGRHARGPKVVAAAQLVSWEPTMPRRAGCADAAWAWWPHAPRLARASCASVCHVERHEEKSKLPFYPSHRPWVPFVQRNLNCASSQLGLFSALRRRISFSLRNSMERGLGGDFKLRGAGGLKKKKKKRKRTAQMMGKCRFLMGGKVGDTHKNTKMKREKWVSPQSRMTQ